MTFGKRAPEAIEATQKANAAMQKACILVSLCLLLQNLVGLFGN